VKRREDGEVKSELTVGVKQYRRAESVILMNRPRAGRVQMQC